MCSPEGAKNWWWGWCKYAHSMLYAYVKCHNVTMKLIVLLNVCNNNKSILAITNVCSYTLGFYYMNK